MTLDHIKKQVTNYFYKTKEYLGHHVIKKFFFIGMIGGILLGWRIQSGNNNTVISTSTYTVVTGNIQNTIDAYGSIELVNEQKIRFNQQGNVTAVYFKKGDDVKKGDIIAEIDQKSLENNITQAEISLADAQLQLEDVLKGNTETQILQAENNLEQSKLKLQITQQEYDNMLSDQVNSGVVNETETAMANARLDIQNYILEGGQMLDDTNDIFATHQDTIGMENLSTTRLTARDSIPPVYDKLSTLKSYFATGLTSTDNKENILMGLSLTRETYQAMYLAMVNLYTAIQNSSHNQTFTQTVEDALASQVYNNSTRVKSAIADISSTINKISDLTSTDDSELSLQSKSNEIKNLKNTITIQENTLEETKKGNTDIQIAQAKNNVRQKEIALETVQENLSNYQIEAPFDGTIRKIDFKVGDKLTATDEKYVYLENPNLVEVSISLDQIDIVNVKLGMPVEVILDSYPNETFEGVLGDIDSTPTTVNGVVSYTVKVAIDKGDKTMYSGMTASVKIIVEDKQNVIIIPTTYIQSEGDTKYVIDANSKQIPIQVGSTNGTQTEVVSGLSTGVIIKKTIATSSALSSSSSSSFGMPGMGGGGSPGMGGGGIPGM